MISELACIIQFDVRGNERYIVIVLVQLRFVGPPFTGSVLL